MGYIEKTYGRSEKFLAFKVCFYDTLVPAREYKSGYVEGSREERAFELAKNEYLAWLEHKEDRYTTVYGYMD